jgi:hypothetical protein
MLPPQSFHKGSQGILALDGVPVNCKFLQIVEGELKGTVRSSDGVFARRDDL